MMHLMADRRLQEQGADAAENLLSLERQLPGPCKVILRGSRKHLPSFGRALLKSCEQFRSSFRRERLHIASSEFHSIGLDHGGQETRQLGHMRSEAAQRH